MTLIQQEPKKIYMWVDVEPQELCFTANTAGSTVRLANNGGTAVSLETSTDGSNWNAYTFNSTITLSNIGDKVYFRNTSETDTLFSTSVSTYNNFYFTGSIAASGDVTYLLNKNGTTTLSDFCFSNLFRESYALTTPPNLPATTLANYCYYSMFFQSRITSIPKLIAIGALPKSCYQGMFAYAPNIKLSTTQTGEYQTEYRIPISGSCTDPYGNATSQMFMGTGGTFTDTPAINTTYYTSNTIV